MMKALTLALVGALTLGASSALAQQASKNIVETAVAAGSFKTLAKALAAADLSRLAQ